MEEILFQPLSAEGGLYLPECFPVVSSDLWEQKNLSYQELFFRCCAPFISEMDDDELKACVREAYAVFPDDPAPLRLMEENHFLLDLFHGPSFAFKDFAMRFVASLTVAMMKKKVQHKGIVLCATSGDTGAAALSAFADMENLHVFVFYPHGGVSSLQERQMHAFCSKKDVIIPIKGSFDDCQCLLKDFLLDKSFFRDYKVMTVNSINWFRILAQCVYYFWAVYRLRERGYFQVPLITIPTGNFGNAFAGYVAKMMGLPIKKCVVATNSNKIIEQAIMKGWYAPDKVISTFSPSMDIQIASNFERLLFMASYGDDVKTRFLMEQFQKQGFLEIPEHMCTFIQEHFVAAYTTEEETLRTIRKVFQDHGILLDPHTAVGVNVSWRQEASLKVTFSTAHPGKFPDATKKACSQREDLPMSLDHGAFDKSNSYDCQKKTLLPYLMKKINT